MSKIDHFGSHVLLNFKSMAWSYKGDFYLETISFNFWIKNLSLRKRMAVWLRKRLAKKAYDRRVEQSCLSEAILFIHLTLIF